jgi:hypothetical protein
MVELKFTRSVARKGQPFSATADMVIDTAVPFNTERVVALGVEVRAIQGTVSGAGFTKALPL